MVNNSGITCCRMLYTLSATAVINLINGLFGTDYPKDSTISYHWTEFEDDQLRRILADTILTINELDSYHIEAQMYKKNMKKLWRRKTK